MLLLVTRDVTFGNTACYAPEVRAAWTELRHICPCPAARCVSGRFGQFSQWPGRNKAKPWRNVAAPCRHGLPCIRCAQGIPVSSPSGSGYSSACCSNHVEKFWRNFVPNWPNRSSSPENVCFTASPTSAKACSTGILFVEISIFSSSSVILLINSLRVR